MVAFTLLLPFHMPISLECDDLRIWGHKKGKFSEKTPIPGEFLESYPKKNPNAGTRGFLDLNFDPFSRVFLFGRLTQSDIIRAPPGGHMTFWLLKPYFHYLDRL